MKKNYIDAEFYNNYMNNSILEIGALRDELDELCSNITSSKNDIKDTIARLRAMKEELKKLKKEEKNKQREISALNSSSINLQDSFVKKNPVNMKTYKNKRAK